MINLPPIKIRIKRSYLTQDSSDLYILTEAYLMAVSALSGQPLLFTAYTEDGAVYTGLPVEALYCDRFEVNEEIDICAYKNEELQPFTCLEGPPVYIAYDLLKNAKLIAKIDQDKVPARYLFTITYTGEGLAEDPEQSKTHNLVVLENGQLAALPNNMCLFVDNWFVSNDNGTKWPKYKRRSNFYRAGG